MRATLAIILRTSPIENVERPVRIVTRLAEDAVTVDLAKITAAARVREESRINRSAVIATTRAAVELAKSKAEIDKIDEITGRIRPQRLLREQYAQSVNHNR